MAARSRIVAALALAGAPILIGGAALAGVAVAERHQARDDFVFEGRGFGHGVGMSQYGARGFARAGWDHARILRHYYRGTRLARVPDRTVRVLLAADAPAAGITSPARWRAVGRVGARTVRVPLAAGGRYRVRAAGASAVLLERDGRRVRLFRGPVRLEPAVARGGSIAWGPARADRAYRGALRVSPAGGRLRVVNAVGLEDYLRGVVPSEMSPAWDRDASAALRAQAIAARTYALATMRTGGDFDVHDDTRSQAYGGIAAEDPRTDRAVAATRGIVITYRGGIITAYFHSTSGGRTEDVRMAWPGSVARPYLVSVPDPQDRISPYHVWADPPRFSPARLGTLLGVGGPVARVEILARGVSPRVRALRVTTTAGRSVQMSGADVRVRLGLRDTWFTVRRG